MAGERSPATVMLIHTQESAVIDLIVGVVEAFVLAGIVGALHLVTSGIIHVV